MTWRIEYTEDAERDLEEILNYISKILLEPETAEKQIGRILNVIESLDQLPLRHRLYDREPWHSKGLRMIPIDNYLIIYFTVDSEKLVMISRIMYAGRDTFKHLNPSEE